MQHPPRKLGTVLVCLELELDIQTPPQWVRAFVSIPGREGTLQRTWTMGSAGLDACQADDLTSWLLNGLQTALQSRVAVQERLPMV